MQQVNNYFQTLKELKPANQYTENNEEKRKILLYMSTSEYYANLDVRSI